MGMALAIFGLVGFGMWILTLRGKAQSKRLLASGVKTVAHVKSCYPSGAENTAGATVTFSVGQDMVEKPLNISDAVFGKLTVGGTADVLYHDEDPLFCMLAATATENGSLRVCNPLGALFFLFSFGLAIAMSTKWNWGPMPVVGYLALILFTCIWALPAVLYPFKRIWCLSTFTCCGCRWCGSGCAHPGGTITNAGAATTAVVVPSTVPAGQMLMSVAVPPNVVPGQQLTVQAPTGQQLMVAVPAGAVPGSTIQVAY